MKWNKEAYPMLDCEGPLGFPMADAAARRVEALLKASGKEPAYRREFFSKAAAEFIDGERADISVITSSAIDRDREVVLPEGIDLAEFRANPVVTFAHRYDELPVGRAMWIKREVDRIKAKTRYTARPENWTGDWLPDAVWHMVRSGDLRGKSIGFLPLEGRPPNAEDLIRRPELARVRWIHTKCLLLEYAVAPVQSNPEALVEAIAKGLLSLDRAAQLQLRLASLGRRPDCPRAEIECRLTRALLDRLSSIDWRLLVSDRLERYLGRP